MIDRVLPDCDQLYAALTAISREALVASGALSLPWGRLFDADRAAVPVAPLHLDIRFADQKVEHIDPKPDLTIKEQTLLLKPDRDAIFESAAAALRAQAISELAEHCRRPLVLRIPSMEADGAAKSVIMSVQV